MKHIFIGNSPIRKNLLANGFGIGVQLLNQIVLVPFYILFWGNELYSDWIVISGSYHHFRYVGRGFEQCYPKSLFHEAVRGQSKRMRLLTHQ